ncbi:MAG: hypothetical protein AAGF75_01835 [Cyanobacteria bacterium P01_H01_bin.130]
MTLLAQVTTQPSRPVSSQAQQQTLATGLAIALTTLIVLAVIFQKSRRNRRGGRTLAVNFGGERKGGKVKSRLRRQLENKVGAGTAARLVNYERSRVPGKPENWYWEAAIERLARDHGRR